MDQLKRQFSGRQKSRSPEDNTAVAGSKLATHTMNVATNKIQLDASVIAKLSAAVAQQVNLERECKTSLRCLCAFVPETAHNRNSDHFS